MDETVLLLNAIVHISLWTNASIAYLFLYTLIVKMVYNLNSIEYEIA